MEIVTSAQASADNVKKANQAIEGGKDFVFDDNPTNNIKNPSSPWTALKEPMRNPKQMKFFGFRFMTIWVLPLAITGTIMEFVFVSPLRDSNPFS